MSIYKPYHLLLLAGVLLLLICLFVPTNETIDFHVHDTYIVVAHSHAFCILAILSYFFWTIYLLTQKVLLSNMRTWLHVILTLAAVVLFLCVPFLSNHRRYMDLTPWTSFNKFNRTNTIVAGIAFSFIITQVLLLVNILGGICKWLLKK